MKPMNLLATWYPYDRTMDIASLFSAMKRAQADGFAGFEIVAATSLLDTYEKYLDQFLSTKLVFTVHFDYLDTNLVSKNKGIQEESIRQLKKTILFASRINARCVVFHPGRYYAEEKKEEALNRLSTILPNILSFAKQNNITLALENMENNKRRICSTKEEIVPLLDQFPDLMLCFDVAHALYVSPNELAVLDLWQACKDRVVEVHLSGICGSTPHYKVPLDRNDVNIRMFLSDVLKQDVLVKLENIFYEDILSSRTYLMQLKQSPRFSCSFVSPPILPRKELALLTPYKPPLKGREGKVCLDFNENTKGASPRVMEAIQALTLDDVSKYPDYSMLKEKLCKKLVVSEDELMVVNGTDEAIMLFPMAYLEKGDEVILPVPTFSLYEQYFTAFGATLKKISYNRDLSFPTQEVLSALQASTKMLVLVSPNNPTGTVIPQDDLLRILKKAKETNTLVILDEAYFQFSGYSNTSLVMEYPNLVVLQTFSKAYGLAGLRVGYIIAQKEVIQTLEKLRPPYNVNKVGVIAATIALDDETYLQQYLEEIARSKKLLYDAFGRFGLQTYPTGANFLIVSLGDKRESIVTGLRLQGILLRDVVQVEPLQGCIRVGIGTVEQTKLLIAGLEDVLSQDI